MARAVYRKRGIEVREGQVLPVVAGIEGQSAESLRSILGNLSNVASREVFERHTGIKLARTQRETLKQLDEWAGVSEEQRAEREAQKDAEFKAREIERHVRDTWRWLENMSVRDDSGVLDGQQYLLKLVNAGSREIGTSKKGAATIYGLRTERGLQYVNNKSFNAFLKASAALGGLGQALELVGAVVAEEAIELSGAELGDFPDTPDGKKALRSAATAFWKENLAGKLIYNGSLGADIELTGRGFKKPISSSADPRKLRLFAALDTLIGKGIKAGDPLTVRPEDERNGVVAVHVMKAAAKIGGEPVTARFIIKQRSDGSSYYDHSVDDAEKRAVLGGSTEALDSTGAVDLNLPALLPSEPSPEQHCMDSIDLPEGEDDFQPDESEFGATFEAEEVALDSGAAGRLVLNLFIDGEALSGSDFEEDEPATEADIAEARADTDTNPTEEQKEAGDYQKGELSLFGLDIAIENPQGSVRTGGSQEQGDDWTSTMQSDYGYIRNTQGADGDEVDVFVGPDLQSERAFVITQLSQAGEFDEYKVLLGFTSEADARSAYQGSYTPDWNGLGDIRAMGLDELKAWLASEAPRTAPEPAEEHAPTAPEPTPEPAMQPEPAPQESPALTEDREFLESILNNTVPDILAPELGDQIGAVYERNADDAHMLSLIEQAVMAYQRAMEQATASL